MTELLQQQEVIQNESDSANPLFQVLMADAALQMGWGTEEDVREALDHLCIEINARGGGRDALSEWIQEK